MKVIIRSDSSSQIGLGHLKRDLILANLLSENGAEVLFACRDLEGNNNQLIRESEFKIALLSSAEISELIELIRSEQASLLVIDHYDINYNDELEIKSKIDNLKILSFDDKCVDHASDFVLNHNISAHPDLYKNTQIDGKLFAGEDYALLNSAFNYSRKSPSEIKNVLIVMGGADPFNFSSTLFDLLERWTSFKITIATTSSNKHIDQLKEKSLQKNGELIIDGNIPELMKISEFAIISSSTLVAESVLSEIPFLAITLVDNQINMYNFLLRKQLPVFRKEEIESIENELQKILTDFNYYKVIAQKVKQLKGDFSSKLDDLIREITKA